MSELARSPLPVGQGQMTAADRLRGHQRNSANDHLSRRARVGLADAKSLRMQIKIASRAKVQPGLTAILLIELDDLVAVDQQFGLDAGDEVRAAIADRLRSQLRDADMAGELDATTFAVLMRDAGDGDVRHLHRRLAETLAQPVRVVGLRLMFDAEFGVATASTQLQHAGLWRRAYAELTGKAGPDGKAWGANTASTPIGRRVDLHDDLEKALRDHDGTSADRGLAVHYQPIIELATGVTQGFEALIRWRHPTLGLVPASELIEVAERTDLIVRLGEWVLNRALSDAVALGSARSAPGYVSVNVSATQLVQPGFAERIRRMVSAAGLEPSRLVVEITESQIVQDDEHIWDDLADLRELGIQVAIDDYGTGYASLAYLRHPVIDMLKLDRSFLAGIGQPRVRTILRSVVALTKSLDISLVVEGLEDETTRSMLIDSGCALGQGHLYAAAMPLSAAMEWDPGPRSAWSPVTTSP